MTTHYFNDTPYDISGQYRVIGKLNMDRNLYKKHEYENSDVLVLYNLQTHEVELKLCFKKNRNLSAQVIV